MAEQFYTILTAIGKAKIANAGALGNKLDLTQFAVGDGNGRYYSPTENQSALVNEVWRGNIGSVSTDEENPNWIVIEVIIPSLSGGFTIREGGVFDIEGNLIAIAKYPETYKPIASDGSTKDLVIRMILEVSNTSSVTLKVDPTVIIATKKDILDHTDKKASTSEYGHVKLNNTLTSESTTEALTAAQGKALNDEIKTQRADIGTEVLDTTSKTIKGAINEVNNTKVDKKDYISNNGYATTTGTSTAYIATLNPAPKAYIDGMNITINPHITCGANPTINVNGLGAVPLCDGEGTRLSAGDLVANRPYSFVRVGTNFFQRSGGGAIAKKFPKWLTTKTNIPLTVGVFSSIGKQYMDIATIDDKAYIFSGANASTMDVHLYDEVTNTVTLLFSYSNLNLTCEISCSVYNGDIYIVSGYPVVLRYNIATNTVSTMGNNNTNTAIYSAQAITMGDTIYMFCDNYMIAYNCAINTYVQHSHPLSSYSGVTFCKVNGSLNILGGSSKSGSSVNSNRHAFNITTGTWTSVGTFSYLYQAGAITTPDDSYVFIVGGYYSSSDSPKPAEYRGVSILTPTGGNGGSVSLQVNRTRPRMAYIRGRVYIFGGHGTYSNSHNAVAEVIIRK